MNLIDQFESLPEQTVANFNAIFKNTPIKNIPLDAEVEIKDLVSGLRRVLAGGEVFYLDLSVKKPKPAPIFPQKKKQQLKKTTASAKKKAPTVVTLPPNFKRLKPSEFKVLEALRILKTIEGVQKLSEMVGINRKTTAKCVDRLEKLGYLKKKASSDNESILAINFVE